MKKMTICTVLALLIAQNMYTLGSSSQLGEHLSHAVKNFYLQQKEAVGSQEEDIRALKSYFNNLYTSKKYFEESGPASVAFFTNLSDSQAFFDALIALEAAMKETIAPLIEGSITEGSIKKTRIIYEGFLGVIDNYLDLFEQQEQQEKKYAQDATDSSVKARLDKLIYKIGLTLLGLRILRSDIVYNQNDLPATKDAVLDYQTTGNPKSFAGQLDKAIPSQQDHMEATQVNAYDEKIKNLPACCKQKADGEKCTNSDECRGSCGWGWSGKRCEGARKSCKVVCEIPEPPFYRDYKERHNLPLN